MQKFDTFEDQLFRSGIKHKKLIELTGKHPSTIRRWIKENSAPKAVRLLVAIIAEGRPAASSEEWNEWRFWENELIDPFGNAVTPGEIKTVWICKQLKRDLERKLTAPVQFLLF